MADEVFRAKAPQIMRNIISDLRVGSEDAAAVLGNFGVEVGGFTLRMEKGKTTFDTTGFGWAQWTGSRRHDFVQWMIANGFGDVANNPAGCPEPRYDAACYGFFIHEIKNTWEKRAIPELKAAQGIEAKTISFMKLYERPGVPHEQRRIAMARIALETFNTAGATMPDTPAKPSTPSIVPAAWMPSAKMQRIIVHWTAGSHKASSLDRDHYHVLIEGDGKLIHGTHSIKENEAPITGTYAAHTLGTNSGSIGVSMCSMMGAIENPFQAGPAPITRVQWDTMVKVVAALATNYKITVTPKTILSHAEVQTNLGNPQRGKWDIARIPFEPTIVGAKACGDKMRAEVRAAMGVVTAPAATTAQKTTTAVIVVAGGGAVAGGAKAAGVDWWVAGAIFIGVALLVAVAISIMRSRK